MEKNLKIVIRFYLFPIFIFLTSFIFYQIYLYELPVRYWDEARWIRRGYFFELFIKKDFTNPLWQNYYSYDQPKMANYFFGAALYPFYLKEKNRKRKRL